MADDNMFELAAEGLNLFGEVTKAAAEETLLLAVRAGVAEIKESASRNTGNLANNYAYTEPIYLFGSYVSNIENNAEYASYEELGHRQESRFVPGEWRNGRFFYDPQANEGMMLTERWVDGSFRLTILADKYNKMLPEIYEQVFTRLAKERGLEL